MVEDYQQVPVTGFVPPDGDSASSVSSAGSGGRNMASGDLSGGSSPRHQPQGGPPSGVLFRSEPMSRCQLILQSEAAYNCVSELGELGLVEFVDLNPEVSSFQRKFISEVKRCEEMERRLRYIQRECIRDDVAVEEPADNPSAPAPREMAELESTLANLERDLSDVTTNYVALRKNHLELSELKHLLLKTEGFLSDSSLQLASSTSAADAEDGEARSLLSDTDDAQLIDAVPHEDAVGMKFNITAGVIARARMASFERMLWRISKGNVFIRSADIDEEMEDPKTGEKLRKVVFMIFVQGEALKTRVKKVCEGYHATVYPCPERASERREMMYGVNTRLEDLNTVLKQTEDHRRRLLLTGARNLRVWYTKTRKIKAIYHCLNLFSFDVTQKALIAECWMPEHDIPIIQAALQRGADMSGSTIPPILNAVAAPESPPTFNRLNKYTQGYQMLVDSYAVNTYRELNPGVYTIATFPFLFAVMFGDFGHGFIVFLAGLWMILQEKKLAKTAENSEIFGIFYGGRYIIVMMGVFSMYTGLIYNDCFAKSMNIFGSKWQYEGNFSFKGNLQMEDSMSLDPGNRKQYKGDPYEFGLDPIWQLAENKIEFLNSYKMKISLIFGLLHMLFGLLVGFANKVIRRSYHDILLEFLPQVLFLISIFFYLAFLIFFKWTKYFADNDKEVNHYSEHCAPNLLITFINMMLFKEEEKDEDLEKICDGRQTYMFSGQKQVQSVLVIFGVLMIPVMLFGKPLHIYFGRRRRRRDYEPMASSDDLLGDEPQENGGGDSFDAQQTQQSARGNQQQSSSHGEGHGEDGEELAFGEIMIYQGIHTIEYVLGSVSHTASYLRLWALSLAHSQLSEVLWNMVMRIPFSSDFLAKSFVGAVAIYIIFAFWAAMTVSILVLMEGLSAFLHTLRLHWVEFQSKFYDGAGRAFVPFNFRGYLKDAELVDKEVLKATR